MASIQASSATTVARRLRVLAQLYQQGQASELMDRTLEKLLAHEADLCREQLSEIQSDLAELEARYGLSTDEFYSHYQAGQTDDRLDYVEWASLVQMRDNLQARLRVLVGEGQPVL
jgi:ATP-dependent helicase YprA (DUF1998 family)